MDYIDRLIALRVDNDLTQSQIASVLSRSQQGYDHIEKRRAKLAIDDLVKLCVFYGTTPNDLLGFPSAKRKSQLK